MSIAIENLSKHYGTQKVLDQITFQAKPGQILGFLGPNGAGKSTTMKIATGYLNADGGDVVVNGVSVGRFPKTVSRMIGYLPEHNPLYLDMYIPEFLSFMGGLYKMKGNELRSRVQTVMDQCGLMPEKTKKISQLSKGYRQRVGLAKSLVHDPEIIILDEPTTGLDPNQLVEIRRLIKEISRDKTLILSTHIMQEVEAICEKVVIIHKGKIVAQDLLRNLKSEEGQYTLILETEESLDLGFFQSLNFEKIMPLNPNTVKFTCNDPKELRVALLLLVQEKKLTLVSIRQQEKNLESVFHRVTQS